MTAATETRIGEVRICDAREYGHLAGFVVEQFGYWNQREPSWAIPAWDERGYPALDGVFPAIEMAEEALRFDGIRYSVASACSPSITVGNFQACDERTEGDNFYTSIYEDDFKGLLIARCNQNGNYPHTVRAILDGLNGKRQSLDEITRQANIISDLLGTLKTFASMGEEQFAAMDKSLALDALRTVVALSSDAIAKATSAQPSGSAPR